MARETFVPVKGIFAAAWDKFQNEIAAIENENKNIFLRARYNGVIDLAALERVALRIRERMLPIPGLVGWLHEPGRSEFYMYRHAIDVAVLAGLVGVWLEYDAAEIHELVFAGLTHDIGKARVPFSIISKPESLDREEESCVHDHVGLGCSLLRESGFFSESVLAGVLQHHERLDGSGYPRGLKGTEIGKLGRVLAIADVYDALVSNRYYSECVSPFEAMRLMQEKMAGKLDEKLMKLMFKNLADGLVGRLVRLNDGEQGVIRVCEYGKKNQPILEMEDGKLLELGLAPELTIAGLIYPRPEA